MKREESFASFSGVVASAAAAAAAASETNKFRATYVFKTRDRTNKRERKSHRRRGYARERRG